MQQLPNQIEQLLKHLTDEQEAGALPQDDEPLDEELDEIIDVYFVKRKPEITVVDATPPQHTEKGSHLFPFALLCFAFVLPLAALLLQGYLAFNAIVASQD